MGGRPRSCARGVSGVVAAAREQDAGFNVIRTSRIVFEEGSINVVSEHDAYDLARTNDDHEHWTRAVMMTPGEKLTVLVLGDGAIPFGDTCAYVMLNLEEIIELAERESGKDLLYRACDLAPRHMIAELARRVRLDEEPKKALRANCPKDARLPIFAAS